MTSHQTPVDGLLRHYETDPARGLTAEQHIGDPTETSIIVAAHKNGLEAGGQTMAFMVLSLSQIVQAFNMRSEHSLFHIGPFTNHKLNWACLISVLLVALVLFTPVGILFELVSLSPQLYLAGLGLALVPVLVMDLSKKFGLIKHQH